jgi:hypothetical protein
MKVRSESDKQKEDADVSNEILDGLIVVCIAEGMSSVHFKPLCDVPGQSDVCNVLAEQARQCP